MFKILIISSFLPMLVISQAESTTKKPIVVTPQKTVTANEDMQMSLQLPLDGNYKDLF